MGDMSEYLQSQFPAYWGEEDDSPRCYPETFSCKYCRENGLTWCQMKDDGKYRLVNMDGKVHSCKEYKRGG